jgi:hypothetical protein
MLKAKYRWLLTGTPVTNTLYVWFDSFATYPLTSTARTFTVSFVSAIFAPGTIGTTLMNTLCVVDQLDMPFASLSDLFFAS